VDFLPLDIPGARVLTFEYDADAAFGNGTAGVLSHAKELLSGLADKREEAVSSASTRGSSLFELMRVLQELQRPIIFIAHSLGGIVVKQVDLNCYLSRPTRILTVCLLGSCASSGRNPL